MYNNKRGNSHSEFLFNKKIVNSKRSQSEIITTVLIILLVLAAIVIVWQVVKSTVSSGSEQVTSAASCIGMSLEITDTTYNATSLTSVKIKRGNDDSDLEAIKIIAEKKTDGTQACNIDEIIVANLPVPFGEKPITIAGCILTTETDYNIKIAPKISGIQCDVADTEPITTP